MKTGVIVYVHGKVDKVNESLLKEQVKRLPMAVDGIRVVSPCSEYFDIMDAWWMFMTKGMNRVLCLGAEPSPDCGVKLNGRQMRLWG